MTARPEPHRDQETIGSYKRTANAALLIYVQNRTREPAPQRRLLRPGLVAATVTVGAMLAAAAGINLSSLPGLG